MPTVMTEEEMKAEEALSEKEREAIRKKIEERTKPRIRPLSEQKAIETGANFVAETFIFAVGIGVIVFEQWRQRRKARNARDDIREDLQELQVELKTVKAELEEMRARHPEPAPSGRLLGFWKGSGKSDEKPDQTRPTESPVATNAAPAMEVQDSIHPTRPNESQTAPGPRSATEKDKRNV